MSQAQRLLDLSRELGTHLAAKSLVLATAESCTAGGIAYAVTQVPGASRWFDRGFVTYSNEAKRETLGVPTALIEAHGAVSEPVARAMALGALAHSHASLAVAVSGIAGPDGGSTAKPVGTVCFAWARSSGRHAVARTATVHLAGDRAAVRTQAILVALEGLITEAR